VLDGPGLEAADRWLREQGISDPARFARVMVASFVSSPTDAGAM
jgi:hypothetical protein